MTLVKHRGFTLVELLVVLAIIGVLSALILPAVFRSQETARRLQCEQRMKQLAVAAASHVTRKGRLPGFQERLGPRIVNWAIPLLPDLGEQPIYDQWVSSNAGAVPRNLMPYRSYFYCPSTGSPDKELPECSYVVNAGFGPRAAGVNAVMGDDPGRLPLGATKGAPVEGAWNDYWDFRDKANGPFVDRAAPKSVAAHRLQVVLSDFRDGVTNTVLFTENLLAGHWSAVAAGQTLPDSTSAPWGVFVPPRPNTTAAAAVRPPICLWLYADDSPATMRNPPRWAPSPPPPHSRINGGRRATPGLLDVEWYRPSSDHPGVVVMAFADGHVEVVNDEQAYGVYIRRMTPDDARSVMPDPGL